MCHHKILIVTFPINMVREREDYRVRVPLKSDAIKMFMLPAHEAKLWQTLRLWLWLWP